MNIIGHGVSFLCYQVINLNVFPCLITPGNSPTMPWYKYHYLILCQAIISGAWHFPSSNVDTKYFEVKADDPVVDTVASLLGTYGLQSGLYRQFPVYKKTGGGQEVLYVHEGGQWSVSQGVGEEQILRSASGGSVTPPGDRRWEYWDSKNEEWRQDPSIYILPFRHPEYFSLEYKGEDQDVKEVFEHEKLEGRYVKQKIDHNNGPYYVKQEEPLRYLFRNVEGFWVVSDDLEDKVGFVYQAVVNDPTPQGRGRWRVGVMGLSEQKGIETRILGEGGTEGENMKEISKSPASEQPKKVVTKNSDSDQKKESNQPAVILSVILLVIIYVNLVRL